MNQRGLRYKLLLIGCFLTLLAGCTRQTQSGDTTTIKFETWVPVSVIFAGIAAFAAGLFLRTRNGRFGWVLLILGPLAAILMGPGMFNDKVTVNPRHFTLQVGFWFAPNIHDVTYADIGNIKIIMEETRGARGRRNKSYYLLCHMKSGADKKVPMGELMKSGGAEQVIEQAQKLGIAVTDDTPD